MSHQAPADPASGTRVAVGIAIVLAVALIVSLVALLAWWSHAKNLAADLERAETRLEEAEREKEEAVEEAYDEGYAAGKAAVASGSDLNATAQAAMETAWGAMSDDVRDSVCLGLDFGLMDAARLLDQFAEPLPGVTVDQLEGFFRQECEAST